MVAFEHENYLDVRPIHIPRHFHTDWNSRYEHMSTGIEPTITLTESDEWWIARDTETGVTSQGKRRKSALDNLDEALAGYRSEGDAPSDDELRELGIDPSNNTSGSIDELDTGTLRSIGK
jgi:predicted RNase H-like HicB family nuclease